MKPKKLIFSIVFLLLLVFGFSIGFFFPTINIDNENITDPKASDGEITIITPENKTYIQPDSGYYLATYGFENDDNGLITPMEWINNTETDFSLSVIEEKLGHKKVVKFLDNSASGGFPTMYNIIKNPPTFGTIEMWLMVEDASDSRIEFQTRDTSNDVGVYLRCNYDKWTYNDVGLANLKDVPNVPAAQDNIWFHLRIDFRCTGAPSYFGLSEATYNVIVNGISSGGLDFRENPTNVDSFIITSDDDNTITFWIDAIGYSWDPNYNIGDNLNEGLLLSYESTTNLDWKGYSLDGQANRTILGNSTIPMPSDGHHSIQMFGNDSMGTIYESGIRYFSVNTAPPEITINSPTDSQVIGNTAPKYDISIIGSYESIWYSLEGGINYSASGLTGTINQTAWNALSDGIITIDFYANNSVGREGTAQVQVFKNSSEKQPPDIPGYNLYLLIGSIGVISTIIIKRKFKS